MPESEKLQISRRRFLSLGAKAAGAGAFAVFAPGLSSYASPYWDIKATREWFPAFEEVARQQNIKTLDDPDGILSEYDEIHRLFLGEESYAQPTAAAWLAGLRETGNRSYGYCSAAARARILFPEPSMEPTVFMGRRIDYGKKTALLTALATQSVYLGFTQYQYGSREYRIRLDSFRNGTAQWPFVGNRPKPGQGGEWYVVCGNVSSDISRFESDDFNLSPSWFSYTLLKQTYDPYLPVEDEVPDALRAEVDYWQQAPQLRGYKIPVNQGLVFLMVYGQERAERATDRWIARQHLVQKTVSLSPKALDKLIAGDPAKELAA